jgi:hypothetical protein
MSLADHPHTDPGDGRTECDTCGKWVWLVTHSCKGVPVTKAAWARHRDRVTTTAAHLTAETEAAQRRRNGVSDVPGRQQLSGYVLRDQGKPPTLLPHPPWDTWNRGYKAAYDSFASVAQDPESASAARQAAQWAIDYLAAGVTGKQAMQAGATSAEPCGAFTNTYGEVI